MIDVETYGAAVGAAKRYTDEHSGSDDAVKYTAQSLTSEQQAQARENIGAAASTDIPTDAVKYTAQALTNAQKTQARTNIGAGTSSFSGRYSDLTDAPPLVKGTGTGGNTIGGTGGTAMNSVKGLNSYAYGNIVGADANYAFAFGERAFAGVYNHNTGKHAVAIGNNVSAEKDYEIAYGKFNQSNADTVFSIGDGTSNSDRHNLIELKTDGTLLLNGNAVKTEGGDDNKLWLGQIYAVENNTYKAGISALFGNALTTIVISSSDLESTIQYAKLYKFGDFIALIDDTADPNKLSIRPLGDHAVGITKVGAWIRIESCYRMFFNLPSVTSLDLSMFDTSGVKNMKYMFRRCTSLTTLDLSSFDMTNVVDYTDMFGGSGTEAGITTLKCPKINPHDDIPLPITLYSQDGTAYTNLPVTTGTSIELRVIFITEQPEDVTVEAGTKFTMSVEAIGEGLTYQWQYMRPTETTWNDFTGATSNILNRTATINWNGWTVHCVITDTNSRTAISDEATITIAPSDGQKYIPDDEKQVSR